MHLTKKLTQETGRDYALRTIKDNIIRLELAPGSMVSEKELSAEMGLSRTPVREALIELSKTKIVEIYPQKGSVVSLIDYSLVEEARFIRNILECAVVELVCTMANENDLKRLEDFVRLQEFYCETHNVEPLLEADNQFHQSLFNIAEKPQAYSLIDSVSIHFDRVRNMALTSVTDLKIVKDHQNILREIANRDAAAARAHMEKHLSRYKIDEEAIREKYTQYFK